MASVTADAIQKSLRIESLSPDIVVMVGVTQGTPMIFAAAWIVIHSVRIPFNLSSLIIIKIHKSTNRNSFLII